MDATIDAMSAPIDGGRDAGTDAGWDAGPMMMVDAGGPPPCEGALGSSCNPIVVETFPYTHMGDTSSATEAAIDRYACAPSTPEEGNEVHYLLRLSESARLDLSVQDGVGVDIDIQLAPDGSDWAAACTDRHDSAISVQRTAGDYRVILDSYGTGSGSPGPYTFRASTSSLPAGGTPLGTLWNTFYYLSLEDPGDAADTPIYDSSCNEIARVSNRFHDSVCIEGSGRLRDGTVINYASTCTSSCPSADRCGSNSYRVCYRALDPERFPWGMGARSNPLEPNVSIAVDPSFIPLGRWIYVEELDGIVPPGETTPHDGCLRADDTGGAIDGNHIDIFVGPQTSWSPWEALLPTRSTLHAYLDHPSCG